MLYEGLSKQTGNNWILNVELRLDMILIKVLKRIASVQNARHKKKDMINSCMITKEQRYNLLNIKAIFCM